MEGDGFLNGFGWVLPVILIVSLLSFGFRYLQRGHGGAEASVGYPWLDDGAGGAGCYPGLGATPLRRYRQGTRGRILGAYPCAPLGPLEAPCIGW